MSSSDYSSYSPSYDSPSSYGYDGYGYSAPSAPSSDLHYKKDGSLDMRYSSSKEASSSDYATSSYTATPSASSSSSSSNSDMHFKKDGSMDMRYNSSKLASVAEKTSSDDGDIHLKKDGTPDMRYKSSKQVAASLANDISKLEVSGKNSESQGISLDIPSNIKTKKDGTPDMRNSAAKEWVTSQARNCNPDAIPNWVPRTKDGSVDQKTAIGRTFASACPERPSSNRREEYWRKRMEDELFSARLNAARREQICLPPRAQVIANANNPPSSQGSTSSYPETTCQIEYSELSFAAGDESKAVIGKGSFGVVLKATWNNKDVAVKKLHLEKLTKNEKAEFCKELDILARLGDHQNIISLCAYCLNPPCIIMELIKLGSLSNLLHYCEDEAVEAKMTDGRVKKNLAYGIANGMFQIHTMQIVHRDLKPQNILVTEQYEAKITDFGFAYLRGKTSSTVDSKKYTTAEDEEPGAVAGTAGYMAPELLDSTMPPAYSSDVYSFGILLNELVSEKEPYTDQYENFAGRGPFGCANYAKLGKRPTIQSTTPYLVEQLITRCWAQTPSERPSFEEIISLIEQEEFVIPNSCG